MDVGASKGLSWEGGCRDMAGGAIDVEGHRGHGCRGIERLSWEGGCRDMAGGAIDVEGHRGHGCRGIERPVVGRWLPGYGRGGYRCRGASGPWM